MSKEGSGGLKIRLQGTIFINVLLECVLAKQSENLSRNQVSAKLMTWFRHSMERYRTWPDKPSPIPLVSILHESRQALIVAHSSKRDATILKKAADVSADPGRVAAAGAVDEDSTTTNDEAGSEGEHTSDEDPTNNCSN